MYDQEKAGRVALLLNVPTYKVNESLGLEISPCLAETIPEARHLYKSLLCEKQRSAYLIWDKLSMEAGEKSQSIFDLNDIWNNAPNRGKAKKYILKKIRNICVEKVPLADYYKAMEIYEIFGKDEKIAELAVTQMILESNGYEEAMESYRAAESLQNYDMELAAIKKIYAFTK